MSTHKNLLIASIAALSMAGCATYQIKYKNPKASPGARHEVKQSFFLWGLVGGQEVDVDSMCPQGVASIESESGIVDGFLFSLTGGLYAPRSVVVQCAGGGVSYKVERQGDRVAVSELPTTEINEQ